MTKKYVTNPATFLLESGLFFEINRQVLHPFGLSIELAAENEGQPNGAFRIVDARDEAEGVVYGPEAFADGFEKLNLFLEEFGIEKMDERREELGYAVQEHPDAYIKKNGVPLITYNPEYNGEDGSMPNLVSFWVPFEWAEDEIRGWFDQSVFEFMDSYVYDQTEAIYDQAKLEGVIIDEQPIFDSI